MGFAQYSCCYFWPHDKRRPGRVWLHYRFRNRGTDSISESGMKRMSGVQSDNATEPYAPGPGAADAG
jgi:hypothetical protein